MLKDAATELQFVYSPIAHWVWGPDGIFQSGNDASPMRSIALAILVLLGASSAQAQSVESFYRGRTINLVIGYSVGGGYDIHGRVLARHLSTHMPQAAAAPK